MNVMRAEDNASELAFLGTIALFRDISDHERKLVAQMMQPIRFTAGQKILQEGDPTDDLVIVREGNVSVSVTRGGEEVEITKLGVGSYFGEMSIFDEYPRSANVTAVADVTAYRIENALFKDFVRAYPAVLFQMCTVFSHRLRNTNSVLARR